MRYRVSQALLRDRFVGWKGYSLKLNLSVEFVSVDCDLQFEPYLTGPITACNGGIFIHFLNSFQSYLLHTISL